MGTVFSLIKGIGIGSGLMYFLDPVSGRRRRAQVRDQSLSSWHSLSRACGAGVRDVGNRASGLAARAGHGLGDAEVDDALLVRRVRSQLGHLISHPRAVVVEARGGHVTLRGPVLAHELGALLAGVGSVPGVTDVDNRLDVHDQADGLPDLQGEGSGAGRQADGWAPANWSPATTLLAGLVVGSLAVRVAKRSRLTTLAAGALGIGMASQLLSGPGGPRLRAGGGSGPARSPGGPHRSTGRESGEPGGGQGRIDEVGHTGVYPASGPFPAGQAEVRTPASFVHGQTDDHGRQAEGGSEPARMGGAVLGGATPSSSSPPEVTP